jgi:hypothetical protein
MATTQMEVTQEYQGTRGLGALARQAVSKKKKRFQGDGFDLDLTYVTDSVIAMGWPAESWKESRVRNPMADVKRFLQHRHHIDQGKAMVYNLCSERGYEKPDECFVGPGGRRQWRRYPFPDHNAPTMELMAAFCKDAAAFLREDSTHVIAVHCKAGKGRTGTMIAALLVHMQEFDNARDALRFYGEARTDNAAGVTIPSQRRFVRYYERYLQQQKQKGPTATIVPISRGVSTSARSNHQPQRRQVQVTRLRLVTVPHFDADGGCDPYWVLKYWPDGEVPYVQGDPHREMAEMSQRQVSACTGHFSTVNQASGEPGWGELINVGWLHRLSPPSRPTCLRSRRKCGWRSAAIRSGVRLSWSYGTTTSAQPTTRCVGAGSMSTCCLQIRWRKAVRSRLSR